MTSMIVAKDQNNAIGYKNELLFDIPEDLDFFKLMTVDNVVAMGRKTFESLGCKPLPNRFNMVLTSSDEFVEKHDRFDNCFFFTDKDMLIGMVQHLSIDKHVFIIGGAEIYNMFMPLADRLYVTNVLENALEADTFFPAIKDDSWTKLFESRNPLVSSTGIPYKQQVFKKKK